MSLRVTIVATTFSEASADAFSLLKSQPHMTHVEIEVPKHEVRFSRAPGHDNFEIRVQTLKPLDRLVLIAFLVSPGLSFFWGESWLNDQFETYPEVLAISDSTDGWFVDVARSK